MINQQQRKYLTERLNNAKHKQQRRKKKIAETKPVVVARKLIRAWENEQLDRNTNDRDLIEARAAKVRELILFGDADKALAAVKAFENF